MDRDKQRGKLGGLCKGGSPTRGVQRGEDLLSGEESFAPKAEGVPRKGKGLAREGCVEDSI